MLMKLTIRRIGNSLGVIVPKTALEIWGIGEGDTLELTERGIGISKGLTWTPPDLPDKVFCGGGAVRLQSYIRPVVQI